ncbi:MAG TPA: hypothetical protein VK081_15015 [Planctomycetota bacterium]|nr:hypothetical protein [Planctomycetota bacterium]
MTSFAQDSLRRAAALLARAGAGPAWTALVLLVLVGGVGIGDAAARTRPGPATAVADTDEVRAAPRELRVAVPQAAAPACCRSGIRPDRRVRPAAAGISDHTLPPARAP